MHEELPDWIQDAEITTGNARTTIPLRAKAIDELIGNLNSKQVSDLVALAFGMPSKDVSSAPHFRKTFREHDVTFKITHEYALKVLSGATLLTLIEGEHDEEPWLQLKALAATAAVSASYSLTVTSYYPLVLVDRCLKYLNDTALQRRTLTDVSFSGEVPDLKVRQRRVQRVLNSNRDPTPAELKEFMLMLKPYTELLPKIPDILHNQDILQEEAEMSWWVQAGYSRERACSLKELSDYELPGVLAYELAQRTRILPSGLAAHHLICHILKELGRDVESITLQQFVEHVEAEWLSKVIQNFCPVPSPPTTPILYALNLVHNGVTDWPNRLRAVTPIDATTNLSTSRFGYCFYLECLVRRIQGNL